MCFLISSDCFRISYPATVPVPLVGLLSPVNMCMAVVLPAPFAPKKPKISPRRTLKEMSSTARKSPKALTKWLTVITSSISEVAASAVDCWCCNPLGLNTSANWVRMFSAVSTALTFPSSKKATRSQHLISSK